MGVQLANGWKLRKRQEECHDKIIKAYEDGYKEFLLAAACRFGKTITTLQSLKDLAEKQNKDSLAVIVLSTMNVKTEWVETCKNVGLNPVNYSNDVEMEINDIPFNELNKTGKDVLYVSTQKLGNGSKVSNDIIKWFNNHEGFKAIVYDECHLGSGTERTRKEIIDRLMFDYKVFLSGTPYRQHLKEEFGFSKTIDPDKCYLYTITDEREDYVNGIIDDYTPVVLKMMVLDYQKQMEESDQSEESEDIDYYGVSSRFFKRLFSESTMRVQAIEFLNRIIDFCKSKNITNGLFFVPELKVGKDIEKNFKRMFSNKIEFRSLCDNYKKNDNLSEEEEKALAESESAALNYFFDQDNPDNKIRIGITCNKCGTGTTIKNLDFVAFLKDTNSAISFIQQSQRVRTPKVGKTEAYVLCFNQWSALKAFEDYARTSYPNEGDTSKAIKKACENGAISLCLNLTEVADYNKIIDLLSCYDPRDKLFDDFDIDSVIDEFTFIFDIENLKKKLAEKFKGLRKDPNFNNAKTLDDLKKALKGNDKALDELKKVKEVDDIRAMMQEAYTSTAQILFQDLKMTLEQVRDFDNYSKRAIGYIEAGFSYWDRWKKLNTEYDAYLPKIYNYLKKGGLIK